MFTTVAGAKTAGQLQLVPFIAEIDSHTKKNTLRPRVLSNFVFIFPITTFCPVKFSPVTFCLCDILTCDILSL